jgi:hypothetical protein
MKILILSSARTGSNYLTTVLQTYMFKDTIVLNEPFRPEIKQMFDQSGYVDAIIEAIHHNDNIILKTHINHFENLHEKNYKDFFLNNNLWYRLLLLRKDVFKCAFSHAVAEMSGSFSAGPYKNLLFAIDVDHFSNIIKSKLVNWIEFSKIKSHGNYNRIIYFEDFSFDIDIDFNRLYVPLEQVIQNNSVTPSKKTPYDILTITNKDELQERFYEIINEFSYAGIKNSNGLLELE